MEPFFKMTWGKRTKKFWRGGKDLFDGGEGVGGQIVKGVKRPNRVK